MNIPLRIYVEPGRYSFRVITLDASGGLQEFGQESSFLNVVYVPERDATDEGLRRASQRLDRRETLFHAVECPDGPPHRAGVLYFRWSQFDIPPAECYLAATARGHDFSWTVDLRQGMLGSFVFGSLNAPELWHPTRRPDTDAAHRFVFTLTPRRLASGLPVLNLEQISNDVLREEAKRNWTSLQVNLAQLQHFSAVTSAKNVAEAILADLLPQAAASTKRRSLDVMLKQIKNALERKNATIAAEPAHKRKRPEPVQPPDLGLDTFDYHLLSAIRELHARTHPERAMREGGPVSIELAMTAVPNLVHILRSLKLVE